MLRFQVEPVASSKTDIDNPIIVARPRPCTRCPQLFGVAKQSIRIFPSYPQGAEIYVTSSNRQRAE
jgi:hypothetical protein